MPIHRDVIRLLLSVVLISVCFATSGQDASVSPAMSHQIEFLGVYSSVPGDWEVLTPSGNMRAAQMKLPGPGFAEVVVYYFGPGVGGSVEANIARWQGQFLSPNGDPVQPDVSGLDTQGGYPATWVELRGSYARGVGTGPVGAFKPNQTLIAAIVQIPKGNVYIQLYGDDLVVDVQRTAFRDFVRGLRPINQQ